jgi:hypothetical protein
MNAFQEGFPDLTVFLTFGYSLPHAQAGTDTAKARAGRLWSDQTVLDGMFDAVAGNRKSWTASRSPTDTRPRSSSPTPPKRLEAHDPSVGRRPR